MSTVARSHPQHAAKIIFAWTEWLGRTGGARPSGADVLDLTRRATGLLVAQYQPSQIKFALAIWALQRASNPLLGPERLDDIAWRYTSDTSRRGRRWRSEMEQAVAYLNTDTATPGRRRTVEGTP